MNLTEAMKGRHSVRQYTDQPLDEAVISALQKEIDACNQESGLHIQLVTNEPKAFDGLWPTMENSAVLRTISQ